MFVSDLVVRRIIGTKNTWQLKQPLIYKSKICGEVKVPKNFIFDFASVPQIFWNILPPEGVEYDRAAVLHDWCYATRLCNDRKKCDDLFLEAMLDDGVPKWKAKLMYWAVRLFGGKAYNEDAVKAAKLRQFIGKDEIELA